jgi:Alpha/beta hydrolase
VSVLAADPVALRDLSAVVGSVARTTDQNAVEVRVVTGRLGPSVGPEVVALAARIGALAERLSALAGVIDVVAAQLARTEACVAAGLARSAYSVDVPRRQLAAVQSVLSGVDPAALEALLVGTPTLARLLAGPPGPDEIPGSVAAQLTALRSSTASRTVVLRQASQLLASLSPDQRRVFALLHPQLVTAFASAPVADRFAACRVLVAAEVARLRALLPRTSGSHRSLVLQRLARYDELLDGVVTLVRSDGTRVSRPHQLLAFDPRGDGRIVEVFGDPVSATHVAVYVPGTGTSLDRYDGNAERASSFAAAAPDVAVVLWQNADFPDQPQDDVLPPAQAWRQPVLAILDQLRNHELAAAYRDAAGPAGAALANDVQGLQIAEPGPMSDLTVLGHSYGGSIVGSAEGNGLRADRIVHIASAGAYVDDVRDYVAGECGARRFSMTAPDDPIQLAQGAGFRSLGQTEQSVRTVWGVLPWFLKPFTLDVTQGLLLTSTNPIRVGHGLDPDRIPGVTRLDTGLRADGRTLVSGHTGMFEPGSTAWRNLLSVMRGEPVLEYEPSRWRSTLVPLGRKLPHYEVTRSPYSTPGYQPPTVPSTGPACPAHSSW